MSTERKFLRFRQFWLNPLLIGTLIGLGYSLTKNQWLEKPVASNKIIVSPSTKFLKNEKSIPKPINHINEIINPDTNKALKSNDEKVSDPVKKTRNENQTFIKMNQEMETKNIEKRRLHQSKSKNWTTLQNSNALEAKTFFENHNIEELLKALPNP